MADTPQFLTLRGNRDRTERMTPAEIAGEARLQQIDSLDKVKWAVLESGGRISFIPK